MSVGLHTILSERPNRGWLQHEPGRQKSLQPPLQPPKEKWRSRPMTESPILLVGTTRFELATSRTPSERATRLRYVPKYRIFSLDFEVGFVKRDYFLRRSSDSRL